VVHSPATVKLLEATDALRERYVEQSNLFSLETKLAVLDLMNASDAQYRLANNKRLHLELSLLKLAAFLHHNPQGPGNGSGQQVHSAGKPAEISAVPAANPQPKTPSAQTPLPIQSELKAKPTTPSPANPPPKAIETPTGSTHSPALEGKETTLAQSAEATNTLTEKDATPSPEIPSLSAESTAGSSLTDSASLESKTNPKIKESSLEAAPPDLTADTLSIEETHVEKESEEKAKTLRRRGQYNTGTLSIIDEHERQNQTQEVFVPQTNTPFSATELQGAVLAFSKTLSTQGKMVAAQMLSRVEVELKSPTSPVFYIPHAGLQTTFAEISADLLQHLRTSLENDFIDLSSEIKLSEQTAKPYTAEEKFNAMAEANPSLIDLKNAFNFEIKP
jgi:DNA polymerase-3 subunit gamma/tau